MTWDPRQLARSIDEKGCLDFLSRLVRFRSVGGERGETALAEFLAERMAGLGLEVELQRVQGERHNAIGVWRGVGTAGGPDGGPGHGAGAGGGRRLILNGHIDTNPPCEGWTVDPWGGVVDERFVYGLGVSNTKAGDAAFFCAVRALREAGVRLAGDVVLMYVVGELQGGIGTIHALDRLGAVPGLAAGKTGTVPGSCGDWFVVAEPTDLAALTAHAGAFNFSIELTGATRHVSKREEAADALAAACALAPRINAASFRGVAGEEHRSMNRAGVGTLRAALTPRFDETRPPQVADFARLTGTARYAISQSEEGVLADLRGLVGEIEREFPGVKGRVDSFQREAGLPQMLPWEVSREAGIVRAVNRAYEAVRGRPQPTGAVRPACFYWTDAAHLLRRAGMEGVVCGPGGRYNTMPDERVDIADYLDMVRMMILTIADVCGAA